MSAAGIVSAPHVVAEASSGLPSRLTTGLARPHLSGLDGLRAIAAFLVVFDHAGLHAYAPGGLGVLAFFVLSGFLITWLLIGEDDVTQSVSLSRFYLRRSFRIFPAFYVYFVLVLLVMVARHRPINMAQTISASLYVTNYYQAIFGDPNTGLSHTWSLAVEEQFYLLWPAIFLLMKNHERRFKALALAIPLLWLYRAALIYLFHVPESYIYEAFDTRADHLLIGCFLAVSLRGGRFAWLWKKACASPAMILVTLLLLAAIVAIGRLVPIANYRDTVEFVVEPVLIFVLIGQLIAFPSHPVTAPFNWAWIRYLGGLSYSIYLYQQLLTYPIMSRLGTSPIVALVITVAVIIIAAACSYHFVERPFLRLRNRFT
jgi:peptidoglycan/LPS O-acetylase OafA/YrhL